MDIFVRWSKSRPAGSLQRGTVVAINDIWQLSAISTLNSQKVVNTFHYQVVVQDILELNMPQALSDGWLTTIAPFLLACCSTSVAALEVQVAKVWPTSSSSLVFPWAGAGVLGTACPPSVSAVVRRRGFGRPRQSLGRLYITGVPLDKVLDGRVIPTYRSVLNILAGKLPDEIISPAFAPDQATFRPVLFNRLAHTNVRITVGTSDDILRSQRRREIGVGI